MAMRTETLSRIQSDDASSRRLHVVRNDNHDVRHEDEQSHGTEFESRLERLTDRFQEMNTASHFVWLANGPHIFDPSLDLSVKVEAIRWMLRISRHVNDQAREVVFLRIEDSLRQLEAAIESQTRAPQFEVRDESPRRSAHG
jgi:hypothetical protein